MCVNRKINSAARAVTPAVGNPSGENVPLPNAALKRDMPTVGSARLYHASSCRLPLMIRSMVTMAYACGI